MVNVREIQSNIDCFEKFHLILVYCDWNYELTGSLKPEIDGHGWA